MYVPLAERARSPDRRFPDLGRRARPVRRPHSEGRSEATGREGLWQKGQPIRDGRNVDDVKRTALEHGRNLGVSAQASPGVVVLEMDSAADIETARALNLGTPVVVVSGHESGERQHWYFARPKDWPEDAPRWFKIEHGRATHGSGYFVAPGSVHPSGNLYRPQGDKLAPLAPLNDGAAARLLGIVGGTDTIPDASSSLSALRDAARAEAEAPVYGEGPIPKGQRHAEIMRVLGILEAQTRATPTHWRRWAGPSWGRDSFRHTRTHPATTPKPRDSTSPVVLLTSYRPNAGSRTTAPTFRPFESCPSRTSRA
jgi:hypothetical protein